MINKKPFTALLLTLVLSLCCFVMPAAAADDTSSEVYKMARELESKYDIIISYPTLNGQPVIGTGTLANLDQALGYVTPELVKQVSAYYKGKVGSNLQFSITNNPPANASGSVLAGFQESRALIQIYIPQVGSSKMITGNTPISILHELGHAVQLMCADSYGFERMEQEWAAYNGNYAYRVGSIKENPNDKVFSSGYGAFDFEEDFADTFALLFASNRDGMGLSARLADGSGNATGLGKKAAYIETMIKTHFTNTGDAIQNLRKCRSVKTKITYKGTSFSGSYLEYRGFNAPPQVLNAMLTHTRINAASTQWEKDIGGWYVTDTAGKQYVLFPGGSYAALK